MNPPASSSTVHRSLPTSWHLARLRTARSRPSNRDWMPARVPGAVQLDWARARQLPDLDYGQNVTAYAGLEDFHWLYRTNVPAVRLRAHERLAFTGSGIDHHAEIPIGGQHVATHTGISTAPTTPMVSGISSSACPCSFLMMMRRTFPSCTISFTRDSRC